MDRRGGDPKAMAGNIQEAVVLAPDFGGYRASRKFALDLVPVHVQRVER
jgi:hypothetical protein